MLKITPRATSSPCVGSEGPGLNSTKPTMAGLEAQLSPAPSRLPCRQGLDRVSETGTQ